MAKKVGKTLYWKASNWIENVFPLFGFVGPTKRFWSTTVANVCAVRMLF